MLGLFEEKIVLPFEYILTKKRRSKHIRVRIKNQGKVHVTAPHFISKRTIEKLLHEKSLWIQEKILEMQRKETEVNQNALPHVRGTYGANAKRAKKLMKERVEFYNQFYKFPYNRISIKQHETRWGSCSRKKNLNFNYRLLFLPIELVDYVAVHEICHLKELNHSKDFWNLVAQQIPDYKERRAELKKY